METSSWSHSQNQSHNNYYTQFQRHYNPDTPPTSSSAANSPNMSYQALHPSSYPHPLPPMSHLHAGPYSPHPHPSIQQVQPSYTHPPPRRPSPFEQQQQTQSAHSTPARAPQPLPAHPDNYYAPLAAQLYNHANALAAQNQAFSDPGYVSGGSTPPRLPPILQVEKQQVTTSATQAASASRRRNEAHFVCPVPGCGSTFTRRFNLRGMCNTRALTGAEHFWLCCDYCF